MGAVVNMAPELWNGVVAAVPFVDVVTTMLDETIPLTTSEYDEWGNPNDKLYYDYILSYSPYDNVAAHAYPNMLVTTYTTVKCSIGSRQSGLPSFANSKRMTMFFCYTPTWRQVTEVPVDVLRR